MQEFSYCTYIEFRDLFTDVRVLKLYESNPVVRGLALDFLQTCELDDEECCISARVGDFRAKFTRYVNPGWMWFFFPRFEYEFSLWAEKGADSGLRRREMLRPWYWIGRTSEPLKRADVASPRAGPDGSNQ